MIGTIHRLRVAFFLDTDVARRSQHVVSEALMVGSEVQVESLVVGRIILIFPDVRASGVLSPGELNCVREKDAE